MKIKHLLVLLTMFTFIQAQASTLSLPADSAITAINDYYSICANSPTTLSPLDNDIIGPNWSALTILVPPTIGSAVVSDSLIIYTPYYNYSNTDSIEYQFTYGTQNYSSWIYISLISPTVNVCPDQSICTDGSTAQLWAQGAEMYEWSPAATLSDSTISNPVASPTETTTYVVTGYNQIFTSGNLVYNGDFEQGNQGFTTSYTYNSNLWNEGTYYVGSSANACHTGFYGYDHTGGGNFLIVNGATGGNVIAWSTTITVQPNTDYAFSAWVCNVCVSCMGDQSLMADLQFSINGQQMGGIFSPLPYPGGWMNFYQIWNSGNNTQAVITILSQNVDGNGNDFGLDDISFAPVLICPFTDSVTVYVGHPDSIEFDTIVCDNLYWNATFFTESGDHTLTFTNQSGCDSVVTAHLTVLEQPASNTYDTICHGDYATFNGNNYYATGIYTDTIPSEMGCDSLAHFNLLVKPMHEILNIYGTENMIIADDIFTGRYEFTIDEFSPCDNVVWNLGGHTSWVLSSDPDDMFKCSIICTTIGYDTLFVTAYHDGCESHAMKILSGSPYGINETLSNSISVSPNPTNGDINFNIVNHSGIFSIDIYNSWGVKVDQLEFNSIENSFNYSFGNLPNGVYHVVFNNANATATKKVILMR